MHGSALSKKEFQASADTPFHAAKVKGEPAGRIHHNPRPHWRDAIDFKAQLSAVYARMTTPTSPHLRHWIILMIAMTVMLRISAQPVSSDDLRALWLAGLHYPDAVYATTGDMFTMLPPPEWVAKGQALGAQAIYPYIYPPIWAHLMAKLVQITDFQSFATVIGWLNAAFIALSTFLAARICRLENHPLLFAATGALVSLLSIATVLALEENQPQILVSFLTLLSIERLLRGGPVMAGAALALAAAIKLYPAVFALFWLAAGRFRASLAFAVIGGGLGLLSIALAGWQLHAAFLAQISAISNSVLVSFVNFSIDAEIARWFVSPAQMQVFDSSRFGGQTSWMVFEKPGAWQAATWGLRMVTLGSLIFLTRRGWLERPEFWPAAMILVALVSPLSWIYYFIAPLAFLPVFLFRFGTARGALLILILLAPMSTTAVALDLHGRIGANLVAGLTMVSLLTIAALFMFAATRPQTPQ